MPSDLNRVPDKPGVVLRIPAKGIEINIWKSYHFVDTFMGASDAWNCTLGDETVSDAIRAALKPGQLVQLVVDGKIQSSGILESITIRSGRSGGTEITLSGRDRLSPTIEGCVDPTLKFGEGMTMLDFLKTVFGPFGWGRDEDFEIDNEDNRGVLTGQRRGKRTTKRGKILKSVKNHQLKPYPNEGTFSFASRICQRRGLYLWLAADSGKIICSTPDFEQPSSYYVQHYKDDKFRQATNVLEASAETNGTDQPTVIIATGFGGGGSFDRASLKAAVVNEMNAYDPLTGALLADVQSVLTKHKDAALLPPRKCFAGSVLYNLPKVRVRFLHDDESHDIDQLQNYCAREMALLQHKAVTYRCTIEGHALQGAPVAIDTILRVDDAVCGLHSNMWIISRTFTKDRGGGTKCDIECVLPYTLALDADAYRNPPTAG